jgi:hypothetical protein
MKGLFFLQMDVKNIQKDHNIQLNESYEGEEKGFL